MTVKYSCPNCGTDNQLANGPSAASVTEIACWSCDEVFEVDRYRKVVMQ